MRVFEVPEPVGPWSTVLVYLPRNRFTAELPERIADAVAAGLRGRAADVRVVRRRQLAGAHRRQRPPAGRAGRTSTSTRSSGRSTSCRRRGPTACGRRSWPRSARSEARDLFERVGSPRAGRRTAPRSPPERADRRRPPHRRAARRRRRADDVARPRRRRPAGRVAVPRLPPGHAGRAVRAAAAARPPRPRRRSTSGRTRSALGDERVYRLRHRRPRRRPASSSTSTAAPTLQDAFAALVAGDGRERRVQPARARRRADGPRGRRSCGPTASTCARSGSRSASAYIEDTLAAHPRLVADLVALFHARFDPATLRRRRRRRSRRRGGRRAGADRRGPRRHPEPRRRPHLPRLPHADRRHGAHELLPRPAGHRRSSSTRRRSPSCRCPGRRHEIWVCGPRVEGVHLRGGDDRPRRAALERPSGGLPHRGARADEGPDGEERRDRADAAPRAASSSSARRRTPRACAPRSSSATGRSSAACSTSPTTSSATAPGRRRSCTRRTPSSTTATTPYLVVAADKGTATFSDIANEISLEYGFWLGDAFASGGSAGYDHKAMGITARGAWESVRRHASVLGKDADRDPLTVVGIGDMSGDVFGNGMLRSRALRLVAAFDHRHVFIDPDPDPEVAVRRAPAAVRAAPVELGRLRPGADLGGRRRVPPHR